MERGYAAAEQDLQTVFSLSPVIQEGDVILFESYARIKHLATRTWLHLDRSEWRCPHPVMTPSHVEVASVGAATEWLGTITEPLAYSTVITLRMKAFSQDGGKPFINCRILIASVVKGFLHCI